MAPYDLCDRSASEGLGGSNLHAAWDRCLIEQGLPGDARTLAGELVDEINDEDRATWQASKSIDWANESSMISVCLGGGYCFPTNAGCWYDAGNERLDEGELVKTVLVDRSYIESSTPTVRDRLVKAGVRLGGLLNRALGE